MFYKTDFSKVSTVKLNTDINESHVFSIIITKKLSKINVIRKYSFTKSLWPLALFTSLFGTQMVRYENQMIAKTKIYNKLYSLIIAGLFVLSMMMIKPRSWSYTASDIPLNVFTICYGYVNIFEVTYAIVASYWNSKRNVKLLNTLDDVEMHFPKTKKQFVRNKMMAVAFVFVPVIMSLTLLLIRKFDLKNIVAHLSIFLILLHGVVIAYLIIHIYLSHLILNGLIVDKIGRTQMLEKVNCFSKSNLGIVISKLFISNKIESQRRYSWFELMQIYDKISDCMYFFNDIYSCQILIMYTSWLLCTLLLICRSLSPSVKYSDFILSDLFIYSTLNSRPLFLAKMCEWIINERKKTLSLLVYVTTREELYHMALDQVRLMVDLVKTRKMEITAKVFIVNPPIVLAFAGRVISFAVLIIQYFYIHLFLK